MRPPRSALPLPRYVQRKPLKSGWGYFFNVPTWARRAGCPIKNEPLGTNYEAALSRAENVLLPAFDSWRSGGESDQTPKVAAVGTLDWLFAEYRADRRYTKLDPKTKRLHESGMRIVGNHVEWPTSRRCTPGGPWAKLASGNHSQDRPAHARPRIGPGRKILSEIKRLGREPNVP
jgi:hypothetical protein